MEALGAVLRRGSPAPTARIAEDRVYEEIEAPKFVDFTVPDCSRPDDRSWFCARIGCDQNHEEVDPDALYKSFVLRVMAARSPNVRLQKALMSRQQAPSAMPTCPRSAPAKSVKSRATKLSVPPAVSEKMVNPSKVKTHPIANLRSTPTHAKAATRPPTEEKAMTTPRGRMRPPNDEAFRSARHAKVRPPVPKNKAVVKTLVFHSPKKARKVPSSTCSTPVSEVSAGLKKIKIGGNPGAASADSMSNAQGGRPLSTAGDTPVDRDACRVQIGPDGEACHAEVNDDMAGEECENGAQPSSVRSSGDETVLKPPPNHDRNDSEEEKPVDGGACNGLGDEKGEKEAMENSSDLDENKENASATYDTSRDMNLHAITNEEENCQSKKCDLPRKSSVVSNKIPQEPKYRSLKSTNPKPFRLRTDERGILREANLERGRPPKGIPAAGRPDKAQGRRKLAGIKPGKPEGAETVFGSQRTKPLCKEKTTQKQRSKAEKLTSQQSTTLPSATASGSASTSLLGDKTETEAAMLRPKVATCRAQAENPTHTATMSPSPQVRRAITIPKEPVFHKIHMPKSCTKRLEKADR